MKRVLITGGYGYVGSELLSLLDKRDDLTVHVLDNLLCGNDLHRFGFIYGDIRNKALLKNILPGYDIIVHLAAIVGQPACAIDPLFAFQVNVQGTKNILDAMMPWQKIIYASSSSVYGNTTIRVDEESPLDPINDYAQHKVQSEWLVRDSGKPYIILRPVTAFGTAPFTRSDVLVNTLIQEAQINAAIHLYEPEVIRPIIHVYDYARILEAAIDGHLGINEIYNIGDPSLTMTKKLLAETIAKIAGVPLIEVTGISQDLRNYDVVFNKIIAAGYTFVTDALQKAFYQLEHNTTKYYSVPEQVKAFIKEKGDALYD